MNFSECPGKKEELSTKILDFLSHSTGLRTTHGSPDEINILQTTDGKSIKVILAELEEVLSRSDSEGQDFIQVNFRNGQKILMTDALIGFKPAVLMGVDMSKLPKVVTTPDLTSIFDAIQDCLYSSDDPDSEVNMLRKVYECVLHGGEAAGFDLHTERLQLNRLPTKTIQSVA